MDFIGSIEAASDPPGVDQQRWIVLIAEHPALAPVPPRRGINPFTREAMNYPAHPATCHVVVDGKEVGMMSWAEDEANQIDVYVYGPAEIVRPIVKEIATLLGATFKAWSAAN